MSWLYRLKEQFREYYPPTKIWASNEDNISNIWIGGTGYHGIDWIKPAGIKRVVNLSGFPIKNKDLGKDIRVLNICIMDLPNQNIKQYFSIADEFTRGYPSAVICYAGRSRSATVASAIIARRTKMTGMESLKYIQNVYPRAQPNRGFKKQLEKI